MDGITGVIISDIPIRLEELLIDFLAKNLNLMLAQKVLSYVLTVSWWMIGETVVDFEHQ